MALGLGSLTSELDQKETVFQSLPQSELMKKRQPVKPSGLPRSLGEALVAEKVLNDKAATAREMSLSMQSNPRTVAQQNEAELQNKAQQEVMQAIAGVYANKAKIANKNMQRMRNQGITRAPVQRRQVMAQGGIVGYQDGGPIIRGLTPEEREQAGSGSFDLLNYIRENPLGALGYGLLGATSLNPLRLGAGALYKGAQKLGGTKLGQKGLGALTNLFTKQVPSFPKFPKNPKSISNLPPITKRVARPGRIAGAAGIGALGLNQLLKPEDSTPVEETPDSIEAPVTPKTPTSTGGGKERDLSRLIYLLRGGTGRDYDLQEFNKKIQQDTLIAKQELNKINSANVLQNRLTQVNAEIAALQEQLYNSPINAALRELEIKKQEAITDGKDVSAIQEQINLQRIASAEELERYADPQGTGDVGLLVQRRQLQARVNELQQGLMNDPMDSVVARNT